jgi:glycosyltransferase involved in cell wall biosynthesis
MHRRSGPSPARRHHDWSLARAHAVKILTFVNAYLPGFKSGGPIQSIAGMVDRLSDHLQFFVFTDDRDAGDREPYRSIEVDRWQRFGGASVFYASSGGKSWRHIARELRRSECDVVYLNSFFHPVFTLRPLVLMKLGLAPDRPVVVAPRGELLPGALAIKSRKKWLFIHAARAAGLYRGVVWQASAEEEAECIRAVFGGSSRVLIAPDLRPRSASARVGSGHEKVRGRARLVFLSRISRKKNLLGALRMVQQADRPIDFDIFGPVSQADDRSYWSECEALMRTMPPQVTVTYRGVVPNSDVRETLSQYDALLLPTEGENFGHAIVDALQAGCPVLISDQTPWRGLTPMRAGWDLPLSGHDAFIGALRQLAAMDDGEWQAWSQGAISYCAGSVDRESTVAANLQLFRVAIGEGSSGASSQSPEVRK